VELDDFKVRWEEQDRKWDQSIRLNRQLFQAVKLGKAETALYRLSFWLWIELVFTFVGAILVGSFIGDHFTEVEFLIPAILLHLFVVALLGTSIRQLVGIAQINFADPIITNQKKLEKLRMERIWTTKWVLLLSPLLWTPLFIVMMKGLLDVDIYSGSGLRWVVANLLFGLLVIMIFIWASRRYATKWENSSFIQRLLRDLAGHNMNRATEFLTSLSEFEKEESSDEVR
jgi:hypothetical protein